MDLTLYIWRQPGPSATGKMVKYEVKDVNEHSSFLEMLDVLNETKRKLYAILADD